MGFLCPAIRELLPGLPLSGWPCGQIAPREGVGSFRHGRVWTTSPTLGAPLNKDGRISAYEDLHFRMVAETLVCEMPSRGVI